MTYDQEVRLAKAAMRIAAPYLKWSEQMRCTKDYWLDIVRAILQEKENVDQGR